MYGVVGTDGVVYGPVPMATLYEWIAQGRIVPGTELIDWQGRRLVASRVPELQGAFPVPNSPYAYGAPAFYRPTKSKRTALWLAFLVGFLGAHRFYLGHTWTGVAMLALNVAVLGFLTDVGMMIALGAAATVWLVVDMVHLANGSLRAADGTPLG